MSQSRRAGEHWARFYLANRRALTVYALAFVGNAADARDLIQDVLLRLVEGDAEPRHDRAFVLRCLRNLAIDRRRRNQARPASPLTESNVAALFDLRDADLETREIGALAQSALAELPEKEREVIVLKVYAEMTLQQIAEILERPAGTVASSYARGIAALRAALAPEKRHA